MKRAITLVILFASSACGLLEQTPPAPRLSVDTLDLYLSRASLLQTDYEQYKISPPYLIMECGVVRKGRHTAAQQKTVSLDDEAGQRLLEPVYELAALLQKESHQFAEPGKNSGMADPGQLFLDLRTKDGANLSIRSSVDWVGAPRSSYERKLLDAVRRLRGAAGQPPCGMADFSGIGAEAPEA